MQKCKLAGCGVNCQKESPPGSEWWAEKLFPTERMVGIDPPGLPLFLPSIHLFLSPILSVLGHFLFLQQSAWGWLTYKEKSVLMFWLMVLEAGEYKNNATGICLTSCGGLEMLQLSGRAARNIKKGKKKEGQTQIAEPSATQGYSLDFTPNLHGFQHLNFQGNKWSHSTLSHRYHRDSTCVL